MNSTDHDEISSGGNVEQRVFQNAGPAALTGALLLVYGFFMYGDPGGEGVYRTGETLFLLTLKLGGLAMLGVAVWSAFGHMPAILGDAFVSALVGLGLLGSAILLTLGGGFTIMYALYVIFALMLFRSAASMGMVYVTLLREANQAMEPEEEEDASALVVGDERPVHFPGLDPSGSSAQFAAMQDEEPIVFDKVKPATPRRKTMGDSPDDAIRLEDMAPTDGHLARLARRDKE